MRTAWIESILTKLFPLPPLLFSMEPPSIVMLFPLDRLPPTWKDAPPGEALHLGRSGVIDHARQQRYQGREVAIHHGEVLHLLRRDDAGALAGGRLHGSGVGLDRDRFGDPDRGEFEIAVRAGGGFAGRVGRG
jgi:hypothetical protein